MPNRILREGILTSTRIAKLTWKAEVFYRRLMSVVDDHGTHFAEPSILRAHLYPLKLDEMREAAIMSCIDECVEAGLIVVYTDNERKYLQMQDFRQQCRSKPKHPLPSDSSCYAVATQVQSSAHLDVGVDVDEGEDVLSITAGDVESIYQAYPRKVGKAAAIKAIKAALKNGGGSPDQLKATVQRYAQAVAGQDKKYIPHPATWFNAGRYEDDPAEWSDQQPAQRTGDPMPASLRARKERNV